MNDPPTPRSGRSPAAAHRNDAGAAVKPTPIGQPIGMSPRDAEAAFRSLYAEHRPTLLRLATALTSGDRDRAEDLVQETMLLAWTHRDNVAIRHRCPQAWLITVARHLAVDAHRARRARPQEAALDENLAFFGSHPIDVRLDEVALRAAVATLPGRQRQVLTEVYYHDRSAAETACILHIPLGTVRSRIFYGLRALRRALPAHDALA